MKYIHLYTLFLLVVFHSSCGHNQTVRAQNRIESETKDSITSRVPFSMVRNVKQDRNGNILIASYKGILRYNGKSFTNITSGISSPSFWDVLEDRKGNLWCGTRDSGVYFYNGKSFRHFTTNDGLASNSALHLLEDNAGNIWFGTGRGLSRWDGMSFRNFAIQGGFLNNDINTVMQDKTGKLWIGTRGKAFIYDGKTFTTVTHDGKAFNNVWGITEDRKGNIWLGDNGLWRYDSRTFIKVSERGAYAMIEDKKGNIWTTGPLNPFDGMVWVLSRYDQKSLYNKEPVVTEIMSIKGTGALCGIVEANDGSIWFGALGPQGGLYRYDGKTITDFTNREGQK